jgi:hypothetical protein
VTVLELIRRVTFQLEEARLVAEHGDHDRARRLLGELFYDFDEWLLQLAAAGRERGE